MSAPHTPGPWVRVACEHGQKWAIVSKAPNAYELGRALVGFVGEDDDARLIVAAPLMHDELGVISEMAHRAANGSLKRPGKPVRVGDLNNMLRRIRDIANDAIAKAEEEPCPQN